MDLVHQHCTPPQKGGSPLAQAEANDYLQQLKNDWQLENDASGIHYDFQFKNFHETMAFVNAVAWIAHREDHHPDLEIGYKHCHVHYSTHAVGGLSLNDFICAARIDALQSTDD